MANLNQPMGFKPICYRSGAVYNGAFRVYYKQSSDSQLIACGDAVVRETQSADPNGGPMCKLATVGSYITGIVVGILPDVTRQYQPNYLSATQSGYVQVADDPSLLFEVQEGGSGTALAITNINNCINATTYAAGSTATGYSAAQIDNNAISSGNTYRIEYLKNSPDNTVGAYAKWVVSANLHTEVNAGAANLLSN